MSIFSKFKKIKSLKELNMEDAKNMKETFLY